MGYRWGAEGCHDLELVDTGTAVPRTGGAAIGDLVMVLPSARKKDGCVRPGEVGKFIKDDNDRQPFKIERLDGSNSDYYYEGDMRKATDAEIAASACTRTHASHAHRLTRRTDLTGNVCDVCRAPSIGRGWRCTPCDYDVCDSCIEHSAASITLSSANATLGAKVRHEEFGEGTLVGWKHDGVRTGDTCPAKSIKLPVRSRSHLDGRRPIGIIVLEPYHSYCEAWTRPDTLSSIALSSNPCRSAIFSFPNS